jgi:hypothetical protein
MSGIHDKNGGMEAVTAKSKYENEQHHRPQPERPAIWPKTEFGVALTAS